jgi:ACT domain-containing protein
MINRQTLVNWEALMPMTQIRKEDCLSIDDAAANLEMSRSTLYAYMNMIDAQRLKFRKDKRTYIQKIDIERIRKLKDGEEGSK